MHYTETEAYKKGREACQDAKYRDDYDNPYTEGSEKWKLWNNGWNSVPADNTPNEYSCKSND